MAPEIRAKFLMMYWPSIVSPKGNFVKTASGKTISGRKVPSICGAMRIKAIQIVLRKRKNIPMRTSHTPRTLKNISGFHQVTVSVISSFAGLRSTIFNAPNQMKRMPRDTRVKSAPYLAIQSMIKFWYFFIGLFLSLKVGCV